MSWTAGCFLAAAAFMLGQALQVNNGFFRILAFRWLLAGLAVAVAGVAIGDRRTRLESTARAWLHHFLLLCVLIQCAQLLRARPLMYASIERGASDATMLWSVIMLGALAIAVAFGSRRIRNFAFAAFVVVHLWLGAWVLRTVPDPAIDVVTVHREAIEALGAGRSPYSISFTNIYRDGKQLYAEDLTAGGRVLFGLPYPPLTLAFAAPAEWALGDFRYAEVAAVSAAGLLIASLGWTRHAMLSAALFLTTPRVLFELEQGWTEPYGVVLLALTVALIWRQSAATPVALGLTMAVKQYLAAAILLTPLLPAKAGTNRWRTLALAILIAGAVTLPFAIWDPYGFFKSVVWLQFREPFRKDSLSVLALLASRGITLPTIGTTIVAGGLAVALALWRLPRSSGGFAAGMALMTFAFFAFGKKAFCNYYFFVLGALAIAIAATAETVPASVVDGAADPGSPSARPKASPVP